MNDLTMIYGLNDPQTGKCRYVGKTSRPAIRLTEHLNHRGRTYRDGWIQNLNSVGLRPTLEILDMVPLNQGDFWEREYIKVFRALGMPLTNLTDGGDGPARLPRSVRDQIRKSRLGQKHTPEAIEKMRHARRNRKYPPMLGKRHSAETRKKMCVAQRIRRSSN